MRLMTVLLPSPPSLTRSIEHFQVQGLGSAFFQGSKYLPTNVELAWEPARALRKKAFVTNC